MIQVKFVPEGLIEKILAVVQVMAWCRSGRRQAIVWTNHG